MEYNYITGDKKNILKEGLKFKYARFHFRERVLNKLLKNPETPVTKSEVGAYAQEQIWNQMAETYGLQPGLKNEFFIPPNRPDLTKQAKFFREQFTQRARITKLLAEEKTNISPKFLNKYGRIIKSLQPKNCKTEYLGVPKELPKISKDDLKFLWRINFCEQMENWSPETYYFLEILKSISNNQTLSDLEKRLFKENGFVNFPELNLALMVANDYVNLPELNLALMVANDYAISASP